MSYVALKMLSSDTCISKYRLLRLIDEGKLIAISVEGKIFIDQASFEEYLRGHKPIKAEKVELHVDG
jgi:hypothetical protein